jgi:UDP-N-acetylmuramoyl-tripeptide--D-alanyl-D-alanine ligase
MTIWSAKDAMKATHGKLTGQSNWVAAGLSIDSRTVKAGDLFIALNGDNFDAHDYVAAALENGAVGAIVSKLPAGLSPDAPLLLVEDCHDSMLDMAEFARARTGAKIIAITGSVGKSSTKEMLAAAFTAQGQTHAAQGSYNNHLGVPYTLASMHAGTDYGVFEIGMNHSGEIMPLTAMVQPDIAIITNIAAVHTENFPGGIDEIAQAKAEIFTGVKSHGAVILNRDDAYFNVLERYARDQSIEQVYSFGEHEDADARIVKTLEGANGIRADIEILGIEKQVFLPHGGMHSVMNAVAALLAVRLCHCDIDKAIKALAGQEPMAGRGKREMLNIGVSENPVTLIDDSFNASPKSMQAGFKVLALIDPGRGGRRIAILGDMHELGSDANKIHAELALPLRAANIDLIYTCGPLMKNLHDALPAELKAVHKDTSTELAQIVPEALIPGDVVMVKGSKASKMGVVVEAMRKVSVQKDKKEKQ